MSHPLLWPPKTFFYPVGNTSAVCLTQDLAPEQAADVLLLGCGDPRNILYTAFADLKLHGKPRKYDITCLDLEPAILARNILLFSLLHSNEPLDIIWNIFYHFKIDDRSYTVLKNHSQCLMTASQSLRDWTKSDLGTTYKMCSTYTLSQLHRLWTHYAEFESVTGARKKGLEEEQSDMGRSAAKKGLIASGSRSAGMLWPLAMNPTNDLFHRYWRTGTTFTSSSDIAKAKNMNPTFTYSLVGEAFVPHYGTNPAQAFHLISAYAPIVPPSSSDIVSKIWSQFQDWATAYRRIIKTHPGSLTIRFGVGDVLSFCRALEQKRTHPDALPSNFIHQWSGQVMDLDAGGLVTAFDIIDTSNLIDHVGLLNILLVTHPLLKSLPSSTMYTEALLPLGLEATTSLKDRLCGDITTTCALIGLVPRAWVSNFTSHSNIHEVLFNAEASGQFHERMAWCVPNPDRSSLDRLAMKSGDIGKLLFNVYDQVHCDERLLDNLRNPLAAMESMRRIHHYNRATFACLAGHIKTRLDVDRRDWDGAMQILLDAVQADRGRMIGMNNYQDFCLQLHIMGVTTTPYLSPQWNRQVGINMNTIRKTLPGWTDIPPVVCIVLAVPRERFEVLWAHSDIGSFPLIGRLLSSAGHDNFFSCTMQAVPGKLVVKSGSPPDLFVEEDARGLKHAHSLIVSFIAPTSVLSFPDTKVALAVKATGPSAMSFMSTLGPSLELFSASLQDGRYAYVTRHRPVLNSTGALIMPVVVSSPYVANIQPPKSVQLDGSGSVIASLTSRVDLTCLGHQTPLAPDISVTAEQTGACEMTVKVGGEHHVVSYSYPVNGAEPKLRIARKSLYIEIITPLYDPTKRAGGGYLKFDPFPIINSPSMAAWNLHNIALGAVPELDRSKSSQLDWVNTQVSLAFSDRENAIRKSVTQSSRLASDMMVNLKDSFHTFFCRILGLAGANEQSRVFGLHFKSVGTFVLIFINRLCLDPAAASLVADVAILPLDRRIMDRVGLGLQALTNSGPAVVNIVTTAEEAVAWKQLIPAVVERCRTWSHSSNCEYASAGRIPLSVELDETPICSCGFGVDLPASISGIPSKAWKLLRPFTTRAALSPLFAVSYVEPVASDAKQLIRGATAGPNRVNRTDTAQACQKCGGLGKPKLLQCSKCKIVKYCSKACATADWKDHKAVCQRA